MEFEWDEQKNQLNQQKHGVSFEEAIEIFNDSLHISTLDFRFSYLEERWISIGSTSVQQIVVVAHLFITDQGEELVRLVSARKADKLERQEYEKC
jgi:uncharacterized protein